MEKARAFAESSRFSREYGPEGCRLGIIASGVARNYLADALASGGWEERVRVLELGMTWPLPEGRIEAFLQSCDRVLVLEGGEPLLEGSVRALAQKCGCKARIEGKDETLTVLGECSTTLVLRRVADYLDCPCPVKASSPVVRELPVRPPNLCAGCLPPRRLLRRPPHLWRRRLLFQRHRLLHPGHAAAPAHGRLPGLHGLLRVPPAAVLPGLPASRWWPSSVTPPSSIPA